MRTMLALTAFVVIGTAGAAHAADQAGDGARKSPIAYAVPANQMKANIDTLGYDVDFMKKDDGAYKVQLTDRASRGKVNVAFDATTGELMYAKLAREDGKAKKREHAHDRKEGRERKEHGENHD